MEWAATVRIALGVLFATAAIAKGARLGTFATSLAEYRLLPARAVRPAATIVAAVEALVAASLLLGVLVDAGLALAAAVLVAFAAAAAVNLRRGRRVDCGCLGDVLPIELDWVTVGMNLALAGAGLAALTQPVAAVPLPSDGPAVGTNVTLTVWMCALTVVIAYWLAGYARTVSRLVDRSIKEASS